MPDPKLTIREQLEKLQLEEALEAAEKRANHKLERSMRQKEIAESIQAYNEEQKRIQASCRHRKGGKGVEQLYMGSDSNYAIIKHTFASGKRCVVCMRCRKYVEEPAPLAARATKAEREEWMQKRTEFEQWWNLPTDNEESGTRLFILSKGEEIPVDLHA
jgi:hypothetical protein